MTRVPDPLEWLAAGVPLTLLLDLFGPAPTASREIYRNEPADDAWLHPTPHAA